MDDKFPAVVGNLRKTSQVVVKDVEYFRAGGRIPPELQELLQVGGTSGTPVWSRVMGDVTSKWEDPGKFPPQGGPLAGKDAAEEDRGK